MRFTLLLIPFLFIPFIGLTQLTQTEIQEIRAVNFHDAKFDPRRPKFLKVGNNALVNYNPISLIFGGALYVYQKAISPQLQSHCPYEISCSAFSMATIQEFGLVKGVALSADRLTRCTQFSTLDLMPSQINQKTGSIIDDPSKYRVKDKSHLHLH
jgi:putative component of membrane protein insertase Oxa1/YidC/SpoIIIJ protein YidD